MNRTYHGALTDRHVYWNAFWRYDDLVLDLYLSATLLKREYSALKNYCSRDLI